MNFDLVEAAIRTHVETQWALSAYSADFPLVWENETQESNYDNFIFLAIEGTFAEKTIYGSVGKRSSVEGGIIFFHAFGEKGRGKSWVSSPIVSMAIILELQVLSSVIDLEGANPPSPIYDSSSDLDRLLPSAKQMEGNYYRCSGSVPFIVRGTR